MGDPAHRLATPSQTVGPFFRFGLTAMATSDLVPAGSPGAVPLTGRVLDGDGVPVPDAMVEIWAALPGGGAFGRSLTAEDGGFRFVVAKPPPRNTQAPHLELVVFARGLLERVATRMYFPDEAPANASDPLLAGVPAERRHTLQAERAGDGELRFDIRLQGDDETVFLVW